MGSHKERRLSRAGATLTAAISPMVFSPTELDVTGKADLLQLTYFAHQTTLSVRPEHPVTAKAMTCRGEAANR